MGNDKRLYAPVLGAALRYLKLILAGAVALLAGAMLLASHMGGEFLPKLGEGPSSAPRCAWPGFRWRKPWR